MAKDTFLKLHCSLPTSTKLSNIKKPAHRWLFVCLMICCQRQLVTRNGLLNDVTKGLLKAFVPTNARGLTTGMLRLTEAGLIKPNGWVINFEEKTSTPESRRQAAKRERDMSRDLSRTSNGRVQSSEFREQNKKKIKKISYKIPATEVIEYLNTKTGKGYKSTTDIEARLKDGFSVDECMGAIDLLVGQWMSDEKMCMYLKPSTIFGKQKFPRYVDEAQAGIFRVKDKVPHLKPNKEALNG